MIKNFLEIDKIIDNLSDKIKNGEIKTIALIGDLGTGKTYITKRIMKNLGYEFNVKSPTFNYVNTYEFLNYCISHFDVYRLSEEDEIYSIGYEDYLDGRILIIEWADKILNLLPEDSFYITLKYVSDDKRDIETYYYERGEKKYVNFIS